MKKISTLVLCLVSVSLFSMTSNLRTNAIEFKNSKIQKDSLRVLEQENMNLRSYDWDVSSNLHGPLIYKKHGEPLNGFNHDFYPNGKVRVHGNFKNGKPLDSLVYFYPNGATKKHVLCKRKTLVIHEYDPSGVLTAKKINSKKSRFLKNYKWYTYYDNGTVKRIEKRNGRKHTIRYKEYYENGVLKEEQRKNKRIEYYPNSELKLVSKREKVNRYDIVFGE